MQWLYHLLTRTDAVCAQTSHTYAPASLVTEGFVHASFASEVQASADLYFASEEEVVALQIAPHRLPVALVLEATPRGPMPHIFGPIPRDAVMAEHRVVRKAKRIPLPDRVMGLRVALLGFPGMTLLDLVGVWDPLARIESMGFDAAFRTEVITLGGAWAQAGMHLTMRETASLAEFDAVVVAGGPSAAELARDPRIQDLLRTLPENRLLASVCTGALFLGELGRLRGMRATTHASALAKLEALGAIVETAEHQRIVDAGEVVTAGGVAAGIDLGLYLAARFYGTEVADAIALQMNYQR